MLKRKTLTKLNFLEKGEKIIKAFFKVTLFFTLIYSSACVFFILYTNGFHGLALILYKLMGLSLLLIFSIILIDAIKYNLIKNASRN